MTEVAGDCGFYFDSFAPGHMAEAVTAALAAGCGQVNSLKGRKAYKDANTAYQAQDYRKKSEERFNQWAKELRQKASVDVKDLTGLL